MNENEIKIKLRTMLAKAKFEENKESDDGNERVIFYDGKATAFAEAIELIERMEKEGY